MSIETVISLSSVIISTVGVLAAMSAIWIQTRQANLALGVEILRGFQREFYDEMRGKRFALATFLLGRTSEPPITYSADILDFFDALGLYMRKGVLDKEMCFYQFYYWLGYYWQHLEKDADFYEQSAGNVSYYANVRYLYNELTKYAQRTKKIKDVQLYYSVDNIRMFLQQEIEQTSFQKSADEMKVIKPDFVDKNLSHLGVASKKSSIKKKVGK